MRVRISFASYLGVVTLLVFGGKWLVRSKSLRSTELSSQSESSGLANRSVIHDFALFDQNGDLTELYRQKNAKGVVLISFGIGCPIAEKSLATIDALAKKYQSLGIRFFLIDANPQDGRRQLFEEASSYHVQIPILVDDTQDVLRSLGVTRTAEALLIETKSWQIAYRGPVGDRYGYGVDNLTDKNEYLDSAIDRYLKGESLQQVSLPSLGCAISFEKRPLVTYHQQIEPLIRKKCAHCHAEREGGISPQNLFTYNDLKGWSSMVREVIRTERMPPWEYDTFYFKVKEDPSLSSQEKKTIYAWIDAGYPEGAKVERQPKPPAKVEIQHDISLPTASDVLIAADDKTPWHYEKLLGPLDQDLWISALQTSLSNRAVVQHIAVLVMNKPLDTLNNRFLPEFFGGNQLYSIIRLAGSKPLRLDPGCAFLAPKGSYLYLEMHFATTGKPETERATVHLQKYTDKQSPKEFLYRPVIEENFVIPPNKEKFVVRHRQKVDRDFVIVSASPHMHMRGLAARLNVHLPDQTKVELLSNRFTFKSRAWLQLDKPYLAPAGSTLEAVFVYDNSAANPASIDFNRSVGFGEDASEGEMAVMHIWGFEPDRNTATVKK